MHSLRQVLPTLLLLIASFAATAAEENWESPTRVDGTQSISLEQAKALHAQGMLFVDVRSPRQFKKRHIPGAVNLYIKDNFTEASLLQHLKSKDTPFIVYCNGAHCSLSYKAAEKGVAMGFTGIHYFRAGARAWRLDGNPLQVGDG